MDSKNPDLKWQMPRKGDRDEETEKIADRVGTWRTIKAEAQRGGYLRRIRPEVFVKPNEGKVVDRFLRRCWMCNVDTLHSVRMFIPDRDHGPVRARLAFVCDGCGYVWDVHILSEKLRKSDPHQDREKEEIEEGQKLGGKPRRKFKLSPENKKKAFKFLKRRNQAWKRAHERNYAKKMAQVEAGKKYLETKKAKEQAAIDKRQAERAEKIAKREKEKADRMKKALERALGGK